MVVHRGHLGSCKCNTESVWKQEKLPNPLCTESVQGMLSFLLFLDTFSIQRILPFLLFLNTFRLMFDRSPPNWAPQARSKAWEVYPWKLYPPDRSGPSDNYSWKVWLWKIIKSSLDLEKPEFERVLLLTRKLSPLRKIAQKRGTGKYQPNSLIEG